MTRFRGRFLSRGEQCCGGENNDRCALGEEHECPLGKIGDTTIDDQGTRSVASGFLRDSRHTELARVSSAQVAHAENCMRRSNTPQSPWPEHSWRNIPITLKIAFAPVLSSPQNGVIPNHRKHP